jgi:hypothetical protein
MRPVSIVFATLACLLAASCSGDEADEHAEHSAFVDRFAERYCSLVTGCCSEVGNQNDPKICRSAVASVMGANVASLENGRASFDAQAAEQCLEELDAFMASCSPASEHPAVCGQVVRGKVAAGGACRWTNDCAPASGATVFCQFDHEAAQGECVQQPPPVEGMACDETACDADPTLYCDFSAGTCAARPGAGGACDIDIPCGPGTRCVGTQCAAEQPIGGDCSLGQPCAAGSYCAAGVCSAQKAGGEPCTAGSKECASECDGSVCAPVEPPNIVCYASE